MRNPHYAFAPKHSIRFLQLILLAGVLSLQSKGQASYDQSYTLLQDGNLKVELEYRIINTCNTQKMCRYRYRITGQPSGYRYINYVFQYYNCSNTITRQPVTLNIADYANSSGLPVENPDWSFAGFQLYVPYAEVEKSNSPSTKRASTGPLPISSAAKRIAGDNVVDYGSQSTLQVDGGALGDKARWVWYTSQCGGTRAGTGEKISISPKENTVYYVRAESPTDTTTCTKLSVVVNTKSRPADHIDGAVSICKGAQGTPLTVSGGKLGMGAKWIWYEDSCSGRSVGTGNRIYVSPQRTTTYLVRAEGTDNITDCRRIVISIVNDRSKEPDAIKGRTAICMGDQVDLQVSGGHLASDAEWHWYKNAIDPDNEIGKGERLQTNPSGNATYFVRAEGACNTTGGQQITVMVNSSSSAANSIVAPGTYNLHTGNRIRLSVLGGTLGNNAEWVWYKNGCDKGRRIRKGEEVTVRVRKKTTYYVRAEGMCNTTSCVSKTFTPSRKFEFLNVGVIPNFGQPAPGGGSKGVGDGFSDAFDQQSYSITFGQVKRSGWYIRGKYTFNNAKSTYRTDNVQLLDYTSATNYYEFNGKSTQKRFGITGGLVFDLSKNWLFLNLGLGYGKRDLLWGADEVSYQTGGRSTTWAKNEIHSYEGIEGEAGIMIKCWILNIMAGANGIFHSSKAIQNHAGSPFIDVYAGVGFNF